VEAFLQDLRLACRLFARNPWFASLAVVALALGKLVATMGLQWDKALLQSILDGNHVVDRKASSFFGGVALSLDRPRPPKTAPPTPSTAGQ
jgi:hypothetical protein